MTTTDPRELLAQADRWKATARGAERVRALIRLGEQPQVRRGLLGMFRRDDDRREPVVLSADDTFAVYEALATVRDDAERRAAEIEARVEVSR